MHLPAKIGKLEKLELFYTALNKERVGIFKWAASVLLSISHLITLANEEMCCGNQI